MDTNMSAIIRSSQPLTDEHIQYFLYQVLRGLKYIHSANIMHRDLKPANILINSTCDVKICDLGLARGYDKEATVGMSSYVVTRWYRAPELLLGAYSYTKGVDMWSVGCIFAELIGRAPLFQGANYLDQIKKIFEVIGSPSESDLKAMNLSDVAIKQLQLLPQLASLSFAQIFPNANPVALDLLSRMLRFDPNQRITSEEALAHPYFDGMHDVEDEPVCDSEFDFSFEREASSPEAIKSMYNITMYNYNY
jgi:mitogen-activated protein kinase 7